MRPLFLTAFLLAGCAGTITTNETSQSQPATDAACSERFEDGSSACDEPTFAVDLQGTWCRADTLCLVVYENNGETRYLWTASDCQETGNASGSLEFSPSPSTDLHRACFAQRLDLYSASVDRIDGGIQLFLDGASEPVSLYRVGK